MDIMTILGIAASILTSASLIPQVAKILQNQNSESVSIAMVVALFAGHSLWIAYGLMKDDYIIVASNVFAALVDIITFVLGLRYKNGPSTR